MHDKEVDNIIFTLSVQENGLQSHTEENLRCLFYSTKLTQLM